MSEQDIEIEKERKAQQAEKEFLEAKEVMDALGRYVNYHKSTKAFIEAFTREHRTLQQSTFRMFLALMEHMASNEYQTDGRNEDSKNMAKILLEGFKIAKKKQYVAEGTSEQRAEEYITIGDGAKPSKYLSTI